MNRLDGLEIPWWRRGVVYQVYLRSFADSNGDGTGDVNGLRSRLPYLADLGVTALWITPWYRSPMADGGYDVADYRDIEPCFGTLADAEQLISDAHDQGIRIIADLVPNHTSTEHDWFKQARTAPIGDPSRDRYHIRDGKGADGAEPPTDWTSVFGGSAWTRLPDGQWYLHLFAREQPDLNWGNAEVRAEFESIFRFWLDRGVDGFRIDVAHGLVKDPTFPDVGAAPEILVSANVPDHPFWDRDGIHEIVPSWRAIVEAYDGYRILVAEAWVRPERLPLYLRPDEYHQSFNFDLLKAPWDAARLRAVIDDGVKAAAAVGSTSTWVLSNHDVMREATRYGLPADVNWRTWPVTGPAELLDEAAGIRRARAAALLMLALPGSAYIYQGEELGLPEVCDLPTDVLDDPVWERSNHTQRGRDGSRVPLPWDRSKPAAGFGSAPAWLPQPEGWGELSVAAQREDPDSTLQLYRAALALRRRHGVDDETLDWLDTDPGTVAFRRGSGLRCVANLGPEPIELPEHAEVLLTSSGLTPSGRLGTDDAAWLL
ncbi:MAG: glycoside hydrolase family 13 protein [Acidimicrobiia bacterium]|nr:glycoside hydrolase family 13 protein [Acidimicrobiia bacterium]